MNIGSANSNYADNITERPLQVKKNQPQQLPKVYKALKVGLKKANTKLGFIVINFVCKTAGATSNSLVRPDLEQAVQLWFPNHREDVEVLETMQRCVTICS